MGTLPICGDTNTVDISHSSWTEWRATSDGLQHLFSSCHDSKRACANPCPIRLSLFSQGIRDAPVLARANVFDRVWWDAIDDPDAPWRRAGVG